MDKGIEDSFLNAVRDMQEKKGNLNVKEFYGVFLKETGTVTGNDTLSGFVYVEQSKLKDNTEEPFELIKRNPYEYTKLTVSPDFDKGLYSKTFAIKLQRAMDEYSKLAGNAFLQQPYFTKLVSYKNILNGTFKK